MISGLAPVPDKKREMSQTNQELVWTFRGGRKTVGCFVQNSEDPPDLFRKFIHTDRLKLCYGRSSEDCGFRGLQQATVNIGFSPIERTRTLLQLSRHG